MVQKCVFCRSSSTVKNGLRKRKVRTKQSYLCLSCKKQFVEPDGFERIIFVCDGSENYRKAFNKLFYRVARLQFGVPIACKKYELEHNNNPIERYNGKIKDRLNGMRSQFKSFDYANSFLNSWRIVVKEIKKI